MALDFEIKFKKVASNSNYYYMKVTGLTDGQLDLLTRKVAKAIGSFYKEKEKIDPTYRDDKDWQDVS